MKVKVNRAARAVLAVAVAFATLAACMSFAPASAMADDSTTVVATLNGTETSYDFAGSSYKYAYVEGDVTVGLSSMPEGWKFARVYDCVTSQYSNDSYSVQLTFVDSNYNSYNLTLSGSGIDGGHVSFDQNSAVQSMQYLDTTKLSGKTLDDLAGLKAYYTDLDTGEIKSVEGFDSIKSCDITVMGKTRFESAWRQYQCGGVMPSKYWSMALTSGTNSTTVTYTSKVDSTLSVSWTFRCYSDGTDDLKKISFADTDGQHDCWINEKGETKVSGGTYSVSSLPEGWTLDWVVNDEGCQKLGFVCGNDTYSYKEVDVYPSDGATLVYDRTAAIQPRRTFDATASTQGKSLSDLEGLKFFVTDASTCEAKELDSFTPTKDCDVMIPSNADFKGWLGLYGGLGSNFGAAYQDVIFANWNCSTSKTSGDLGTQYVLKLTSLADESLSVTWKFNVTMFDDVDYSTAHVSNIAWLYNQKISTGWDEADGTRTFRPFVGVARADMAAFLYRLAGSPDYEAPEASPFTDVTVDTPHYKEICWLAESGISEGWAEKDGTKIFRPMETIVRCDMAAFLYRLAGSPKYDAPKSSDFTDCKSKTTAHYREVCWLAESGISEGWTEKDGTKTFRPMDTIARADMAAFLQRMSDKGLVGGKTDEQ